MSRSLIAQTYRAAIVSCAVLLSGLATVLAALGKYLVYPAWRSEAAKASIKWRTWASRWAV